jgi:hypothetical protein
MIGLFIIFFGILTAFAVGSGRIKKEKKELESVEAEV